jgi:organic hydroperoxide reductase OsmC/OhrA
MLNDLTLIPMKNTNPTLERTHPGVSKKDEKLEKHKGGVKWIAGIHDRSNTRNTLQSILGETVDGFHIGRAMKQPEYLMAMAHAESLTTCAVTNMRSIGLYPISLNTEVIVSRNSVSITAVHLSVTGFVRGITAVRFYALILDAIKNCPVSKALAIPITSEVVLSMETGLS